MNHRLLSSKNTFIVYSLGLTLAACQETTKPSGWQDYQHLKAISEGRAMHPEVQVDEESTGDWQYDDQGESEVEIRPEYDEFNQNQYLTGDEDLTLCKIDSDCPQYPYLTCQNKVCRHKGIFPIYFSEFVGLLVLTVLLALANVGGIGGGGLIIPIMMALFTFTTKEAIAISGFTIFTGSVARFIYSWNQRHPEKDATMIDYGIVIVMMPLVLVGSFVGVLLNIMLPPIILSSILTLILVLLTAQSLNKGLQIYRKETAQQRRLEQELARRQKLTVMTGGANQDFNSGQEVMSPPGTNLDKYKEFQEEESQGDIQVSAQQQEQPGRRHIFSERDLKSLPLEGEGQGPTQMQSAKELDSRKFEFPHEDILSNRGSWKSGADTTVGSTTNQPNQAAAVANATEDEKMEVSRILDDEKSHFRQWRKHLMAIVIILVSLIVNFLRGSRKTPSIIGITKCGTLDWSIFTAFLVIAFFMSYLGVLINMREQALKEKCGVSCSSDLKYRGRPLFYLLFFAFIGGWVSGAFGLGGGSVFNPLMIELGVPPQVSTSTGMYMIMFSTFASSVIYISYGALNKEFAVWLGLWSILGIVGGIMLVDTLIKRYNRQSIIVFILCLVLAISAILVPLFNGLEVWQQIEDGKEVWKFTSICS